MTEDLLDVFHRLSTDVIPLHYDLKIHPNLETFKFEGTVVIDVEINQSAEYIELHNVELTLLNIEFCSAVQTLKCVKTVEAKRNESVRLYFESVIQKGTGKIKIDYTGNLNENLQGFYKTRCIQRDLTRGYAAMTQFEPNYARRAFPCFDEPAKKATFDITIVTNIAKTVLSNMPLKDTKIYDKDNSLTEYHFERTPIMPTYLVAFIVGEFDYVEKVNDLGTLVRVYTPVGKAHMGNFTLDITVKALSFYTKYFDLEYPLPKLDLIGLEDVEIEAMENWGLITFKESLMLIDESNFSVQSKAEVALIVSHEIAHQWFGNIVTMEWWTHLWLNEGFATWIEYLSVDYILKDWEIWSYYAFDHLMRAFELDSLESSHPIEINVGPPSEINQIFDSISYCKGSSIIRMLNSYMGDDFLRGLQNYLKKYKFKNASTDDLWKELSAASNKDIKDLMQNWTKQTGYPLICVSKHVNESHHTILKLKQRRFFKNAQKTSNTSNVIWKIPITIKTRSSFPNLHAKVLMDQTECEIDLGKLDSSDYIILNSDCQGFYRCFYSEDLLNNIINQLKDSNSLFGTTLDRITILNDAFALTWSNDLSASDLFELMLLFSKNETNTYVWMVLLKQIQQLNKCLINTNLFERYTKFLRSLYANIVSKLGFEIKPEEDDLTRLLHEKILYALAKTDDQEFSSFAKRVYEQRSVKKIPADQQKSVFTAILRDASQSTVKEFIEMYKECFTPEEKERTILMLSEVTDIKLIQEILQFSISPVITKEETVYLLVSIAENTTNKDCLHLIWSFVKQNWTYIYSCYCESLLIGRLLKPIIQNFTTQQDLDDVENFFRLNPTPQADQAINQAVEIVKSKMTWLKNQLSSIETFLNNSF